MYRKYNLSAKIRWCYECKCRERKRMQKMATAKQSGLFKGFLRCNSNYFGLCVCVCLILSMMPVHMGRGACEHALPLA